MLKKLAHPIGHKLIHAGKPIAVGGEWELLWGGNFLNFTTYDRSYYWIDERYTTKGHNIETDIESSQSMPAGTFTSGYIKTYYKFSIPNSNLNDRYVMLEFPFNPYKNSKNVRTLRQANGYISNLKVGLIRECENNNGQDPDPNYQNEFAFNIASKATSIVDEGDYNCGIGSWEHTVTIPNISYTNTFSYSGGDLKIRLLCDLRTKSTYFKLDSSFPDIVRLSDYIDTGFDMLYGTQYNQSYNYIITVYADGVGLKASQDTPYNYVIAGYHAGTGTPITVKSYS